MVTTISQAGNCINDPGVPEKCTHRKKKIPRVWIKLLEVSLQVARSSTIRVNVQVMGPQRTQSPTMTETSFPRKGFACGHSTNSILSCKANARAPFEVITSLWFIRCDDKQAGRKEQWDVLAVQGLYKLVQRSLWYHPVSNEPHNC